MQGDLMITRAMSGHTRLADTLPLARREYGTYGEIYSDNGSYLICGYTGHILLTPESDYPMYYAPYRNYSPNSARWTTRDPLGFSQGQNLYGYVGGNPIRWTDPLGLKRGPCAQTGDPKATDPFYPYFDPSDPLTRYAIPSDILDAANILIEKGKPPANWTPEEQGKNRGWVDGNGNKLWNDLKKGGRGGKRGEDPHVDWINPSQDKKWKIYDDGTCEEGKI
jgi:RHS repeat-associated protein